MILTYYNGCDQESVQAHVHRHEEEKLKAFPLEGSFLSTRDGETKGHVHVAREK